jgi:acyl carrier protein phosphodiesterase
MGGNLKLSCGCSERIILHRAIDTFTDAHPVLDEVLKLHSRYHHYAGVIVDVFYDHFLAKNWVHIQMKICDLYCFLRIFERKYSF